METEKQCKNCEIINADCNACKSFMETKEQKIERLKKEIKFEKEMREWFLQSLPLSSIIIQDKDETISKLEQQLKELEDEIHND